MGIPGQEKSKEHLRCEKARVLCLAEIPDGWRAGDKQVEGLGVFR
jgi:hypothetical protein